MSHMSMVASMGLAVFKAARDELVSMLHTGHAFSGREFSAGLHIYSMLLYLHISFSLSHTYKWLSYLSYKSIPTKKLMLVNI